MAIIKPNLENEINLYDVFRIIWFGKLRLFLIILVFTIIGLIYCININPKFRVSTDISPSFLNANTKYAKINYILSNNDQFKKDIKNIKNVESPDLINVSKITPETVFRLFINEFRDYEEMSFVLNKDNFVKEILKDVPVNRKEFKVLNLARLFKILPPNKNNKSWKLSFEWHDPVSGTSLLKDALNLTLLNVQKKLIRQFSDYRKILEANKSLQMEELKKTIEILSQEMEIIQSKENPNKVLFKILEKKYSNIYAKYLILKNEPFTKIVSSSIEMLKVDDQKKYVKFNMELSEISSMINYKLKLFIFIILGIIVGLFYVLIWYSFSKKIER